MVVLDQQRYQSTDRSERTQRRQFRSAARVLLLGANIFEAGECNACVDGDEIIGDIRVSQTSDNGVDRIQGGLNIGEGNPTLFTEKSALVAEKQLEGIYLGVDLAGTPLVIDLRLEVAVEQQEIERSMDMLQVALAQIIGGTPDKGGATGYGLRGLSEKEIS
jgi:hypothetical protein